MFRGTAHAVGNMYDAWVHGTNAVTDGESCMRLDLTSCTSHYRNTVVDSWSSIGITQVRYTCEAKAKPVRFYKIDFYYTIIGV